MEGDTGSNKPNIVKKGRYGGESFDEFYVFRVLKHALHPQNGCRMIFNERHSNSHRLRVSNLRKEKHGFKLKPLRNWGTKPASMPPVK